MIPAHLHPGVFVLTKTVGRRWTAWRRVVPYHTKPPQLRCGTYSMVFLYHMVWYHHNTLVATVCSSYLARCLVVVLQLGMSNCETLGSLLVVAGWIKLWYLSGENRL